MDNLAQMGSDASIYVCREAKLQNCNFYIISCMCFWRFCRAKIEFKVSFIILVKSIKLSVNFLLGNLSPKILFFFCSFSSFSTVHLFYPVKISNTLNVMGLLCEENRYLNARIYWSLFKVILLISRIILLLLINVCQQCDSELLWEFSTSSRKWSIRCGLPWCLQRSRKFKELWGWEQ